MRKIAILSLGLMLLFSAWRCQRVTNPNLIRVAVASSVQFALADLIEAYQAVDSSVVIELLTGASGKLAAQIQQGAPVDIFIAADSSYPNFLYQKEKALQAPITYAKGQLVIWTQGQIPLIDLLAQLTKPTIRKIALPDPQIAPYGRLARQWLNDQHKWEALRSKLVYGEDVGHSNQYVATQVVPVGFTALASIQTLSIKSNQYQVLEDYHLEQQMLLLETKTKPATAAARQFYAFLQSPAAQEIFKAYGYL